MGLLDMLMPYSQTTGYGPQKTTNPFTGWFDQNRGKIAGAFGGMVGAGNDPRAALTGFVGGLQHGVSVDQENAIVRQQQEQQAAQVKAQQDQQNRTIQWLQQNAPKYAEAVANGAMSPSDAWSAALKDQAGGDGKAGPFDGTSMDAQVGNILLNGDPNSPEYAYAYQIASQPKISMQQTPQGLVPVYQTPDLSSVRKPGYKGQVAQTAMPPVQAPGASPAPAPGGFSPASPDVAPVGVMGPGISVGSALPGTKAPATESQARAGLLATSLVNDLPTVLKNFDALSQPKQQALGMGGKLTNWAHSPEYQQANAALKASVGNIVYAISGANSTPQEQQRKIDEVTPQFGDSPQTIEFKKKQLISYVLAVAQASNNPDLIAKAQEVVTQLQGPQPGTTSPVIDLGNGITMQEIP